MLALALVLIAAQALQARVITRRGACVNGSGWLLVIRVDDRTGRATALSGVRCDGDAWRSLCRPARLGAPPGTSAQYFDAGARGDWIQYDTDADGVVIRMWGFDRKKTYWQLEISPRRRL